MSTIESIERLSSIESLVGEINYKDNIVGLRLSTGQVAGDPRGAAVHAVAGAGAARGARVGRGAGGRRQRVAGLLAAAPRLPRRARAPAR